MIKTEFDRLTYLLELAGYDFKSFEASFHCDLKYEKGNELLDILETIYRAGQQSSKA